MRVATYDVQLTRHGPGLLLADLRDGDDPQTNAAVAVLARAHPDIVLLTGIDYDATGAALSALRGRLSAAGLLLPHGFAARPNTGVPTGADLNGDGRIGGPGDAQGYGHFAGQGAMALLSRYPVDAAASRDFTSFRWHDFPQALLPGADLPARARKTLPLFGVGAWDVVVRPPGQRSLHLLAFAAGPPVFDGPKDRNGRRNHDQIAFLSTLLAGRLPLAAPHGPFVVLGLANLDPERGEGRHDAIRALLSDPRLQDPRPSSAGGWDRPLATADWRKGPGPGKLRVDYVLPSAGLGVTGAGVFWPAPGTPGAAEAARASAHRLVWVDIELP